MTYDEWLKDVAEFACLADGVAVLTPARHPNLKDEFEIGVEPIVAAARVAQIELRLFEDAMKLPYAEANAKLEAAVALGDQVEITFWESVAIAHDAERDSAQARSERNFGC